MTLRQHMFDRIASDSVLNALGLNINTLWAGQAAGEAVLPVQETRLFATLTWGLKNASLMGQRGALRSYEQMLDVYVYNRDPDFAPILAIMNRLQQLCDEILAEKTGSAATDGWISCCEWGGESSDSYDEAYEARMRYASMNIVATGA